MPRATFFRCRTCREEEGGGILLFTPMKWKREGWIVKWRQVGAAPLQQGTSACPVFVGRHQPIGPAVLGAIDQAQFVQR